MKQKIFYIFILLCVGILIYSNSLHGEFQFDDAGYILEDPHIRQFSTLWWEAGSWNIRFICLLSFALNYYFHKIDVFGYHLVNLIIHLLNALLIFQFIRLLLSTPKFKKEKWLSHKDGFAFLVAFLFLTHPLQTQSVTYISQRFASLATFFYVASICFYLKGRMGDLKKNKNLFYYWASALTGLLGIFTKEIVFTLPFVIFLLDVLFIQEEGKSFKKSGTVFFIIMLSFAMIIPLMYKIFGDTLFCLRNPSESHAGDIVTPVNYLLTQFRVVPIYIRLLFFPLGLNLDYDFPVSSSLIEPITTLGGLIFLLFVIWLGFVLLKKNRLIAFGIFWFFITASIESSFIPIRHVIFEHRTYLPSIGFCIAIVFALSSVVRDFKKVALILSVIACVFSFLTYERNKVWKTDVSLWEDVKKKSPQKSRSYINLCGAYYKKGQPDKALEHCNQALELNPYSFKARNNRGLIYAGKKQFGLALENFNEALKFQPGAKDVYNNRGNLYVKQKQYDLAIEDFTKVIADKSLQETGFNNRGFVYILMGKLDLALEDINRAIEINPVLAEAYHNRALVYTKKGKYDLALRDLDKTLKFKPNYANAYFLKAEIYTTLKQYEKAIEAFNVLEKITPQDFKVYAQRANIYFEQENSFLALEDLARAIKVAPEEPDVYYNRGNIYYALRQLKESNEDYSQVIALNPQHFQALNNRGNIYRDEKKYDEAISDYTRALEINSELAIVYFNRAMAFKAKEDYQNALKDFLKAQELGYPVSEKILQEIRKKM